MMAVKELLVEPNPVVAGLVPYVIDRPGIDPDLVLDFNESLAPPPALAGSDRPVHRYPDYQEIEAAIAERAAVNPGNVLVTNGADDALERIVRCAAIPGRRAVLTAPSYGMIKRFAVLAGAEVVEIPWWKSDYPVDEVCRAAGSCGGLISVVSPSNPTGAVISRQAFEEVLDRAPRSLVLLDQAYVDFTGPDYDLAEVAMNYPNAVIVRTFSKAWACAGLRVGCAIGDPRVIDWLRRVGLPFPVSTLSIGAMMKALADGPDLGRIAAVCSQRDILIDVLRDYAGEVLPSEGSFVFARFDEADFVWQGLGALGISVRRFSGREDVEGWIRITLPGDNESFERLRRGLRTVCAPDALLFDMDGVLADVSRSYRQAIIETAATWNVELASEDIVRAKAYGDATNDWELTRRLLAEREVEVDLGAVTDRFETLYQGTDEAPGFRRFETPRFDRETLERLSRKFLLGVVTGRPRSDAQRFLEQQGIADLFSTTVCMEDGPSKPDPAPVRLALERLGATTAWMVGDTPDDMRAARGADVLPIGLPGVDDDPTLMREALTAAGAAQVIDRPNKFEELLP
jgi:histidinol-phosphate aminotransferase